MSNYRTPGVYLEEIPKFPPSIAAVETAIPVFIGCTQIATENALDDLRNVPNKIGSIADYNLYFGAGPKINVTEVTVNTDNQFLSAKVSNTYFLYDSLRLFYANGGGDCYIISIGDFQFTPATIDYTNALLALEKYTEPTIILMPDATVLAGNGLYDVQKAALMQCADLMDRVTLCDLKEVDPKGAEFRNNIGINNLKYGMAYTPWLKASLPKVVTYRDFFDPVTDVSKIKKGVSVVNLKTLTTDPDTNTLITELEQVMDDVDEILDTTKTELMMGNNSINLKFASLVDTYKAGPTIQTFLDIFNYLYKFCTVCDDYVAGGGAHLLSNTTLKNSIGSVITSTISLTATKLISYDIEADAALGAPYNNTLFDQPAVKKASPSWGTTFTTPPAASTLMAPVANDIDRMDLMLPALISVFDEFLAAYQGRVINEGTAMEKTMNDTLSATFPVYKSIVTGINNASVNIPPSGVMAGVYAQVDGSRGVWKAPANVTVNGVNAPATVFTASELDNLNVDNVAGKSINAIRTFTGKGVLVWGARTLAGNDNEWRYINVRRLFNMIEESTKNAVESFTFEANDADTWVKVQAMIENFLTTLWRQGAFFGATPNKAFYVAVGLGKTMTQLDILEGKMIVEIGIAANRPAEFIILKFSHKLPEL